ncbi:unnamed protein product [Didymodactylos carnosus]|uniref:VWFA domain-containing protein n=2 Tax=Didymodactylos carnosus TaxID=1234261 RepID=A0A814WRB0_9BILA|nr:unnamed protein product [Didymodactylos carnosus]CAF3970179.1 unnamed protein product [Didymodactylos carnosus]
MRGLCSVNSTVWSACSRICDGGTRERTNLCFMNNRRAPCKSCNIQDNEVEKCNIWPCPKCRVEVDVGILLDSSSSIKEWTVVVNATSEFVSVLKNQNVSVLFGVVLYANRPQIFRRFNQPVTIEDIRRLAHISGGTQTDLGLITMKQDIFKEKNGDRKRVKNVCVVFTDGESNDRKATVSAASSLKAENVEIYTVGVEKANMEELEAISTSKKHVFFTHEIRDLTQALYGTLKAICPDA